MVTAGDFLCSNLLCLTNPPGGDHRTKAFGIADFLPSISIKAKDLAAEMTSLNVRTGDLKDQLPIEKVPSNEFRKVLL